MEEYNEDAPQGAVGGEGASRANPKKQPISGKKTVVKKATKVAAAPVQVDKPVIASNSPKKTAKKASPKKAVEVKAENIPLKPASTKKISAKTIENEEPAAAEKPKLKKAAATKKQDAAGKIGATSTKVATSSGQIDEPLQTLPGGTNASTNINILVTADPDFTANTGADPVPAIAPVDEKELSASDNLKSNTPSVVEPEVLSEGPAPKNVSEEQGAATETATSSSGASSNNLSNLQKITFQVRYHTIPGQSLYVAGNYDLLGNNDETKAFALNYLNDQYWFGSLEIPEGTALPEKISYSYVLKDQDGTTTKEWGSDKLIEPSTYHTKEVVVVDSWNSSFFVENTFYTEPFQNVLLKSNYTAVESKVPQNVTHIFRAKAPLLSKGQTLCITGSAMELGEWDSENPVLLSRKAEDVWYQATVDLSASNFPIEYKYGVFDVNLNRFIRFEDGVNRTLNVNPSPDKLTVVSDGFAILPANTFKAAGVAIPVFSLRSQSSFGVGEFTNLKLLVDWAKQAGLKLIQLLPVNDTTATHQYTDSYPYAAISAFALHPLYLHLPAIAGDNQDLLNSLQGKQAELNDKAEVDYVGVMAAKWDFIKQIFPAQKQQIFNRAEFKAFFKENAHWLVPYAAFSYLREKYNTSDFNQWPTNKAYDLEQIKTIASSPLTDRDEVSMYYFVQYYLHLQLKDAANYAHANGIIVKGDIPIGIYRNSCDAWQEPQLFNMDMQAGAPPDDFAVKGQNWGFPTYNWQRMRENGFTWWKKRFEQMSHYFDAFRIDHILGFFRIWSIPLDSVEGIMGHFVPALPIHINEFAERGIAFDRDRFTKPYINDSILNEIFGDEKESVIAEFLQPLPSGHYSLKPEFDTQRKVESHFSTIENTGRNQKLKLGLFDLISNVILFEAEGSEGQGFHFRISMDSIPSFRYLESHTQYQLKDLYVNYFFRRQDNFWMKEAMLKLPELKRSTNMLICGEDLGMVPASVPGVMKELAILSLEIQRMPKDPSTEFFHPNNAPYLSVVTPSTHDMSTIRGWWEEDRAATQRFFNNELGQWGTAPYFCEPWINRIILLQHLYSPAMWSIFQLQDLLGIDGKLRRENPNEERINIPADPKHYWRYRMHLTLEELINQKEFTSEVNGYVKQSGR